MEEKTRLFRKTAFGGFHRDDVMRYIEEKKREFSDYKAEVEATIRTLEDKLQALESDRVEATAEVKAPDRNETDLSETAERLKAVADALTGSLNRLIDRFSAEKTCEAQAAEEAPDLVTSILGTLYAAPAPAPKAETHDTWTLDDVLPSYLSN